MSNEAPGHFGVQRACSEKDFEVAEYLLRTLEAIARREANDSSPDRAYRVLAHCQGRIQALSRRNMAPSDRVILARQWEP